MVMSIILITLGVVALIWGFADFNKYILSHSFYYVMLPPFGIILLFYGGLGLYLSLCRNNAGNTGIAIFAGLAAVSLIYRILYSIMMMLWKLDAGFPFQDWWFILVEIAVVVVSVLFYLFGD